MYTLGVTPAGAAVQPVITAVTTDYQVSPPTITISGKYFGGVTPTVTLDGTVLVVVTYTSSQVTALLPANLNPGSYQVSLTNHTLQLKTDFDATIGAAGPEGPAGPAGATGAAGPAGSQGPAGATGATGAMGLTGATGPQGPQGAAGPTGATGPQGLTWQGAWNISATYNLNDAVGFNGTSYISLIANNTGHEPDNFPADWSVVASVGATGPAGPAGSTGTTGPQGPSGPQGPQGITGATGATGAMGLTGATGPQGLAWQAVWNISKPYNLNDAVSYNGSSYISLAGGNTGNEPDNTPASWSLVASVGAAGATGATGPQGTTGATGAMGLTGATGPQGPQGATGATGATGPQGLAWQGVWNISKPYNLNDAVSYNGSSYISLAGGNTGNEPDNTPASWSLVASVGAAGATGATGPAGSTGATGPQGNTGATGAQGPQGATGATGAAGAAGPQGPAGPVNIYNANDYSNGTPQYIPGSFTAIASLSLPPGSYWIHATVNVSNLSTAATVEVACEIPQITGALMTTDLVADNSTVGSWAAVVPLQGVISLSSTTTIQLQCEADPSSDVYAYRPQIMALQVTSITNQ
jgi:hypothetical protein